MGNAGVLRTACHPVPVARDIATFCRVLDLGGSQDLLRPHQARPHQAGLSVETPNTADGF